MNVQHNKKGEEKEANLNNKHEEIEIYVFRSVSELIYGFNKQIFYS